MPILKLVCRFLIFFMFSTTLNIASCYADNVSKQDELNNILSSVTEAQKIIQTFYSDTTNTKDTPLISKYFFSALKNLNENQYAAAAENLTRLKEEANKSGYKNIPSFSSELLYRAEKMNCKDDCTGNISFLVRQAVLLSPYDSSILFRASKFHIGFMESLGYALSGVYNLPDYPTKLITLFLDICSWGLAIISVLLLSYCFFEIMNKLPDINTLLHSKARKFPPFKSILLRLSALALIIIPPFLGIAPCLLVWSFVLGMFFGSSKSLNLNSENNESQKVTLKGRKLMLASTIIIALWAIYIPLASTLRPAVHSEEASLIEDISNLSYIPYKHNFLNNLKIKNSDNAAVFFILAEVEYLAKNYKEALILFKEAEKTSPVNSKLWVSSQINQAAINYMLGKNKEAHETYVKLVEQTKPSFELYYNASLTSLAMLDLKSHGNFYNKAKELNSTRIKNLELSDSSNNPNPILATLSKNDRFNLITTYAASQMDNSSTHDSSWKVTVCNGLLIKSTPKIILGLSLLGLIGVALIKKFSQKRKYLNRYYVGVK